MISSCCCIAWLTTTWRVHRCMYCLACVLLGVAEGSRRAKEDSEGPHECGEGCGQREGIGAGKERVRPPGWRGAAGRGGGEGDIYIYIFVAFLFVFMLSLTTVTYARHQLINFCIFIYIYLYVCVCPQCNPCHSVNGPVEMRYVYVLGIIVFLS